MTESTNRSIDGKPLTEWTREEAHAEGVRLCESYLERRGFQLVDVDPEERDVLERHGIFVVAEDDGDTVLVSVTARVDTECDPDDVPALNVTSEVRAEQRAVALAYAAAHAECTGVRVDVVAIVIVAERTARLRHLIGSYSWEEN